MCSLGSVPMWVVFALCRLCIGSFVLVCDLVVRYSDSFWCNFLILLREAEEKEFYHRKLVWFRLCCHSKFLVSSRFPGPVSSLQVKRSNIENLSIHGRVRS